MSSFCRMTPSICKAKTGFKMLQKCFNSTQMLKSRCVSSNRHQETIIALHRAYNMPSFCRMTPSICKTKTVLKMLRKCFNSAQMVNSRCVSSNRHQEMITALHGPYNGHLEYVFVLQNDPPQPAKRRQPPKCCKDVSIQPRC